MRPVYGTMILLFLQVTFHGISAAGYGGSNDWSFCKGSCSLGQGDCDRDADCSGNLVCGHDNCKQFNSQAHSQADCCMKPGYGGSNDWTFCKGSCTLGQGDCDRDADCSGNLVCGHDNCKQFNSQANSYADCCMKPGQCGSHLLGFFWGIQYPDAKNRWQMAGMYCDNTYEKFGDGTYWLTPDGYKGEGFIAVLDSSGPWKGIILRNTHNGKHKDRSTKEFSLYLGSSSNGPWTSVLIDYELEDSRQQNPPPLQKINFKSGSQTGKYVRFDVDDYYGYGAGLQYLNMIPA